MVAKAVLYVIAVSLDAADRAAEFVNHANPAVVEAAIQAMNDKAQLAGQVLTPDWISAAAGHPDARSLIARITTSGRSNCSQWPPLGTINPSMKATRQTLVLGALFWARVSR